MKKKNLFIILAALTSIFLFTIANLCNITTTEIDQETVSEVIAEEREIPGEVPAAEREAPTISLDIYYGPSYSESDDICYYRIEAAVTGIPKPTVEFSRDDSESAFGPRRCQVNLNRGESYTLTAIATNSEGSATDTITLEWYHVEGEGEEAAEASDEIEMIDEMAPSDDEYVPEKNLVPIVGEIIIRDVVSGDPVTVFYRNTKYSLSVDATDPEGETITYNWTVTGGILKDSGINPIQWGTPSTAGTCTIEVVVSDGAYMITRQKDVPIK